MSLTDRTVLLVEDDFSMRRLVCGFLRDMNCQAIVETQNGEEAMPILDDKAFDLLIIDWRMEPIDGQQLIEHVRQTKGNPNQDRPILVLTGHAEREIVLAARDAGATAIVGKPVSFNALRDKINLALKGAVLSADSCAT